MYVLTLASFPWRGGPLPIAQRRRAPLVLPTRRRSPRFTSAGAVVRLPGGAGLKERDMNDPVLSEAMRHRRAVLKALATSCDQDELRAELDAMYSDDTDALDATSERLWRDITEDYPPVEPGTVLPAVIVVACIAVGVLIKAAC